MILFLTSKFSQKRDDQHKDRWFILLLNQCKLPHLTIQTNTYRWIENYMLGQEKFFKWWADVLLLLSNWCQEQAKDHYVFNL